jgi:hypothetical protein
MKKKTKLKSVLYYLTRLLNKKTLHALVKFTVKKKYGASAIHIPDDLSSSKNILFILPEEPIETLHQLINIISIITYFNSINKSNIIFLCEKNITPYITHIKDVKRIIEYDRKELYLFSNTIKHIQKQLLKEFIDLCLLLEREPYISILSIIGNIQAKIRATYEDVGEFPFFNFRIKISKKHQYRTDQNCIMAEILGAKRQSSLHWSVSNDMLTEIDLKFKELLIPERTWLGGIDILFFHDNFGIQFTDRLIEKIVSQFSENWLLYTEYIPDNYFSIWLKEKQMPVIAGFTPSRQAALLKKTDLFITGNTSLFELANLLQKPVIGFFKEKEMLRYCSQTPITVGIPYSDNNEKEELLNELCKKIAVLFKSDLVGI